MSYRVRQITEALEELGEASSIEIAKHIGCTLNNITRVISRMAHEQKTIPKRIHICTWVYSVDGEIDYLRAVYALGDRRNSPKPLPRDPQEQKNAFYHRERKKRQSVSVFNLGMTNRKLGLSGGS
jgi:hypothetical protein